MIHYKLKSWLKYTTVLTSLLLLSPPVMCMLGIEDSDQPASTEASETKPVPKTRDKDVSTEDKGKDPSKTPRERSLEPAPGTTEETSIPTKEHEISEEEETGSSETLRKEFLELARGAAKEKQEATQETQISQRRRIESNNRLQTIREIQQREKQDNVDINKEDAPNIPPKKAPPWRSRNTGSKREEKGSTSELEEAERPPKIVEEAISQTLSKKAPPWRSRNTGSKRKEKGSDSELEEAESPPKLGTPPKIALEPITILLEPGAPIEQIAEGTLTNSRTSVEATEKELTLEVPPLEEVDKFTRIGRMKAQRNMAKLKGEQHSNNKEIHLQGLESVAASSYELPEFIELRKGKIISQELGQVLVELSHAELRGLPTYGKYIRRIKLSFYNEPIDDTDVKFVIQNCPNLTEIHLMAAEITDLSLEVIRTNCPDLTHLALQKCNSISDEGIMYIIKDNSKLTNLEMVNCSQITDAAVVAIGIHCTELMELNLEGCQNIRQESSLARLDKLCKLEKLWTPTCKRVGSLRSLVGYYSSKEDIAKYLCALREREGTEKGLMQQLTGSIIMKGNKNTPDPRKLNKSTLTAEENEDKIPKKRVSIRLLLQRSGKGTGDSEKAGNKEDNSSRPGKQKSDKDFQSPSPTHSSSWIPSIGSIRLSAKHRQEVFTTDPDITSNLPVPLHSDNTTITKLKFIPKQKAGRHKWVSECFTKPTEQGFYEEKITRSSFQDMEQKYPNLTHLDLSECQDIKDNDIFEALGGCPKLTYLNISGCSKITAETIHNLPEHCPQIRELNLIGCNKIKEECLFQLVELEKLEKLWTPTAKEIGYEKQWVGVYNSYKEIQAYLKTIGKTSTLEQ